MINVQKVTFIKSAAAQKDFISNSLPQVVFAGKSNVGKSSVINKLLNRRNFARVGATPGKTAHVNYFLVDERLYFVDLPGYGYAKVSDQEKLRWGRLMAAFFHESTQIALGILIVDARHDATQNDRMMAQLFMNTGSRFIVLANKSDKLTPTELKACAEKVKNSLQLTDDVQIILFSAEKGTNREAVLKEIDNISKS